MKITGNQFRLAKGAITCVLVFCICFSYGRQLNSEEMVLVKKDPSPSQQVIIHFLKWYKVNLNKANNFSFLVIG